ncbi:hypothetical protein GCM10023088_07870 [Actinomadura verrucosospora]
MARRWPGTEPRAVRDAIAATLTNWPEQLRRSLTWDRARRWPSTPNYVSTPGLEIYFVDPHSPWRRGTNENTNGLCATTSPKAPT